MKELNKNRILTKVNNIHRTKNNTAFRNEVNDLIEFIEGVFWEKGCNHKPYCLICGMLNSPNNIAKN